MKLEFKIKKMSAEEIWDEYSQYIDDNSDSFQNVAGTSVITRNDFLKAMEAYRNQDELPKLYQHENDIAYRLQKGGEVSSLLSVAMRVLSLEQMIALRDALKERTPKEDDRIQKAIDWVEIRIKYYDSFVLPPPVDEIKLKTFKEIKSFLQSIKI